jgi:hypothetical protein
MITDDHDDHGGSTAPAVWAPDCQLLQFRPAAAAIICYDSSSTPTPLISIHECVYIHVSCWHTQQQHIATLAQHTRQLKLVVLAPSQNI